MKEIKEYHEEYRKCPICTNVGENNTELLCSVSDKRLGKKYIHNITTKISICKDCGFIFANPVIPQKEWNEYYNDMYVGFRSEEAYSVDNRIELIKKYKQSDSRIVEIGGNEQGLFSERLKNIYSEYCSYDINEAAGNTSKEVSQLSKTDMLVSYCVLEHIADLDSFLNKCAELVEENGVFIVEVPNVDEYYRNASSLTFCEHINHFTPQSLTKLMNNYGFSLIEINKQCASREVVFAGIYRKQSVRDANIEYKINKSFVLEGINTMLQEENRLSQTVEQIHRIYGKDNLKDVVFWCASGMLTTLINEYQKYGIFEGIIIDEDERKKDYYVDLPVYVSKDVLLTEKGNKIKTVIICSASRVEGIVKTIHEYGRDELEILYIDDDKQLKAYKK